MTACLMIQGTASHVGKSIIATGFCRIFSEMGYRVAPFKSQNMSLNSAVTEEGGEIARAQELQARGARVEPSVLMNPVLLKPKDAEKCEVIIGGRSIGDFSAKEYFKDIQGRALEVIRDSLERLKEDFDLIVIEGAGSPAEVNLREHDLCNMRVAEMAEAAVLLVADIDTGGALASIVGTCSLLPAEERERIKGIIINKFRGDYELLAPALPFLEERTGWKSLGVLPFIDCSFLDEEDTPRDPGSPSGEVAVIKLPYLSNFTDFAPLAKEAPTRWVERPEELDGVKVVIIPGTRNTISDLAWLRERGLAEKIKGKAREGAAVIGICGGFQILGEELIDEEGVEGKGRFEGLRLLPAVTRYERPKATHRVRAEVIKEIPVLPGFTGSEIEGYEIHTGRTEVQGAQPLVFRRQGGTVPDGALSKDGKVFGTHLHGLFNNPEVVRALLRYLDRNEPVESYGELAEGNIASLARVIRENLDIGYVREIMGLG